MDGLLLVDKPKGWTSFDVVAKVRGVVKKKTGIKRAKVGHTGTLDPLATGLLVLTIGKYCKRAQEFSKLDKTYQVTMKLGQTSTTGDEEGEKTIISTEMPPQSAIEEALQLFVGDSMQTPPIYSAIKVNGKRAYDLARQGKEVKLEPRPIHIYSNILQNVGVSDRVVGFESKVSSGTYIRSLVEDIGTKLGTGAYMSDLRRVSVGDFALENAITISDDLYDQVEDAIVQH